MFRVARAARFTSHRKMVFCKIESGHTASVRRAQSVAVASFSVFLCQDKGKGEDVTFSFLWQLQGFLLVLHPSFGEQCRVIALKHRAGSKSQPERKEGAQLVPLIAQRAQTDD